ncbi:MAG: hypothetical protein J3R72DRAFT_501527 [Linnemannia gamsii]|nr:MAG: hypothetical protein J3R72DRAFT_501527 [Linnemannia gamsii]
MAEGTDRRSFDEVSLNALTAFEFPWISHQIEFLECRIVRAPRPDVVTAAVDNDGHFILPDPPGLAPPTTSEQIQTAQQQSHALQRRIFQQLGQLTHLRVLRLGRCSRDWDDPIFSQLDVKGIRTMMIVDSHVQTECLEFSLESGLAELSGLKQLEELNLTQMAHRVEWRSIGLS